jgi:hypothetical protein
MKDMSQTIPTITFENGRTLRTYKGVVIDITPNPVPPEVDAILEKVGFGNLDAYQVLNHPSGADEAAAAIILQRMYDSKCEGSRFHPDDDFEKILEAVCDDLQKDYLYVA